MRLDRRLAMLSLIATTVLVAGPAYAVEPAAPWPDSLWNEPLFGEQSAATASDDDPQFLPPIVLDGAASAAAVAPSAGARGRAAPAQGSAAVPYVAAGRRGDVRAPAVSFPEGVLAGQQMTL